MQTISKISNDDLWGYGIVLPTRQGQMFRRNLLIPSSRWLCRFFVICCNLFLSELTVQFKTRIKYNVFRRATNLRVAIASRFVLSVSHCQFSQSFQFSQTQQSRTTFSGLLRRSRCSRNISHMPPVISSLCFRISALLLSIVLESRDTEPSNVPLIVVLRDLAVLWNYCELSVTFKIILAEIFVYFVLILFHAESCKSAAIVTLN